MNAPDLFVLSDNDDLIGTRAFESASSFLLFLVVESLVSFSLEKPWVSLHVFVYWSGHASRVNVWMPFRRHYRILQFDVSDCDPVDHVNGKDKGSKSQKQIRIDFSSRKPYDRQTVYEDDENEAP